MLSPLLELLLLTAGCGVAIPIGGFVASIERLQPEWLEQEFRHSVIAFGGGALTAAVALVLIPEGTKSIAVWESLLAFLAGGAAFWGLQCMLDRHDSPTTQLAAMLSDFVPEVIALGATISIGKGGVFVLASIITLQNLPEGFNAYRELTAGGLSKSKVLVWFCFAALLGPLLGSLGYWFLADATHVLGWLQVFASAGILYLVFEDVAPQAKLNNSAFPAVGAVLGFLLGLAGHLMTR